VLWLLHGPCLGLWACLCGIVIRRRWGGWLFGAAACVGCLGAVIQQLWLQLASASWLLQQCNMQQIGMTTHCSLCDSVTCGSSCDWHVESPPLIVAWHILLLSFKPSLPQQWSAANCFW
jgi:hypothetical protein